MPTEQRRGWRREWRSLTLVLWVGGCAQVQRGGSDLLPDLSVGGGGDEDLAGPASGVDLAGADFVLPPGADLAGLDLAHAASGDMATVCDLVKQTGCGVNEKCTFDGTAPTCFSMGTNATGALCGPTADDCVKGNLCTTPPGATPMDCHQFCNSDTDCKQGAVAGGVPPHCFITVTGLSAKLCSISCNPFNAMPGTNGCPAGLSCGYGATMVAGKQVEVSECDVFGTGDDGVACVQSMPNTCKPGYECVSEMGGGVVCRQVCNHGASGTCKAGYKCYDLSGFPMGTTPLFGVCGP